MSTKTKNPLRPGLVVVLAAAAALVSAALVWSGTSAVATIAGVAATGPGRVSQAPERPASPSVPPRASQAAGAAHHLQAPEPASARPLAEMQPGPSGQPGLGNKPEVSLEEAGRAEVGQAASSGKDPSRNLARAGKATPDDVLGATPSLGGCIPEYGNAGQCLPAVPPSLTRHVQQMRDSGVDPATMPHSWTCDEARKYFANGLSVRETGVDPQKLDANMDGIACGPAD